VDRVYRHNIQRVCCSDIYSPLLTGGYPGSETRSGRSRLTTPVDFAVLFLGEVHEPQNRLDSIRSRFCQKLRHERGSPTFKRPRWQLLVQMEILPRLVTWQFVATRKVRRRASLLPPASQSRSRSVTKRSSQIRSVWPVLSHNLNEG
jgi:hypothetical protein